MAKRAEQKRADQDGKPLRPSDRTGRQRLEKRLVGAVTFVLAMTTDHRGDAMKNPDIKNSPVGRLDANVSRRRCGGRGRVGHLLITPAEVEEIFRRFSVQRRSRGRVEHQRLTLPVAVVLSAQATDAA